MGVASICRDNGAPSTVSIVRQGLFGIACHFVVGVSGTTFRALVSPAINKYLQASNTSLNGCRAVASVFSVNEFRSSQGHLGIGVMIVGVHLAFESAGRDDVLNAL